MNVFDEPKIDCHCHVLDPARFAYAPDVAYRPAGQEIGPADQYRQVMDAYNASGGEKISDLQIIPIEVDHPVLGKRPSVKLVGKTADGQPFEVPDALDASFKLFSAEKQFDMLGKAQDKVEKKRMDDADIKLKGAQAEYFSGRNETSTTNAETRAAGKGARGSNFTEKEWDAANKIEPSFVSFTPEEGGKAVESPELRLVYRSAMNAARVAGEMAPNEAAEAARTTVLKLKNKATEIVAADRAANPKSTLTETQAVQKLLKQFEESQRKPAPAAPGPNAAPQRVAAPATPAAMAAQGVQPAQAPAARVPGPPPELGFNGNPRAPNPAFAAWQKQFGQAWAAQQAADEAAAAQERSAAQAIVDRARGGNVAARGNF